MILAIRGCELNTNLLTIDGFRFRARRLVNASRRWRQWSPTSLSSRCFSHLSLKKSKISPTKKKEGNVTETDRTAFRPTFIYPNGPFLHFIGPCSFIYFIVNGPFPGFIYIDFLSGPPTLAFFKKFNQE